MPTATLALSVSARKTGAAALLAWYDRHARRLPWRIGPAERAAGVRPDPYRVWLSEIMLQQTTVATVGRYYALFTRKWPTVARLAAAADEDIMRAWAGLGYYARARNLLACARAVANGHGGRFPATVEELKRLPGIGDYTAAAIAAIAFDAPVAVVDGNVERVMARRLALETPLPTARPAIREAVAALVPQARPGDFAQAVMDLGATICTPKRPACALCPWRGECAAASAGTPERYPLKAAKAARPTRHGIAYVAVRADGAVLLGRRPGRGLLGGMTEVPGTAWGAHAPERTPPLAAAWRTAGSIEHVFTHFRLVLEVRRADVPVATPAPEDLWWSPRHELDGEALPTVFRKVLATALGTGLRLNRGAA